MRSKYTVHVEDRRIRTIGTSAYYCSSGKGSGGRYAGSGVQRHLGNDFADGHFEGTGLVGKGDEEDGEV